MIEWGLVAIAAGVVTVSVVIVSVAVALQLRRRHQRHGEPRFGGKLKNNIESMREGAPFRQYNDEEK